MSFTSSHNKFSVEKMIDALNPQYEQSAFKNDYERNMYLAALKS
jgi:hypothetical protein